MHPMSPFKAQGANQALLDALSLARRISGACELNPRWRDVGIRKLVLNEFEEEMARRSASKVEDSAKAARLSQRVALFARLASFVVLGKIVLMGFAPVHGSAGWHAMVGGWSPVLAEHFHRAPGRRSVRCR